MPIENCLEYRHWRRARERESPREGIIKHRSERKNIARKAIRLPLDDFGGHVRRRSDEAPRCRHAFFIEYASNAKIGEFHRARFIDEDVFGLDIAMDNARLVSMFYRIAHRTRHGDGDFGDLRRMRFDEFGERWPLDELHDEVL